MFRVRSVALAALVALVTTILHVDRVSAQTLDLPGAAVPSTVGRAGSGVVAADDTAALWLNPAGLARRQEWRLQLGLTWVARSGSFHSRESFSPEGAAEARQLAGPQVVPSLAVQGHLGERVVVGLAWLTPTDFALSWPAPDPTSLPTGKTPAETEQVERAERARYPLRYAAGDLVLRKRGVALGASVHMLPWLAVGASAWLVRAEAAQSRSLWGGQGPITAVPNLTTAFDLRFAASGKAWMPGAALGALVAPLDAPVEMAVSLAWNRDVTLVGTPTLSDSRGSADGQRYVDATITDGARATLDLPGQWLARGGVRFFNERLSLEADAAVARGGAATPAWRVEGVSLAFTGAGSGPVEAVPLGTSLRDGFSLGVAFDADVVPGFVTLGAGWSYVRGVVARTALSPALPALDAHTFALGATVRSDGYSVVLGVAYTPASATQLDPGGATVVAPLAEGQPPAARGTLDVATTLLGVSVETEL